MGKRKKLVILLSVALAVSSIGWGSAQDKRTKNAAPSKGAVATREAKLERIRQQRDLPALRRAAALRAKQLRARTLARELAKGTLQARASAKPLAPLPLAPVGSVPHYFGPFPNYANSPLPRGPIASAALMFGGSGYVAPTVVVEDLYGTGSGAQVEAVIDPAVPGVISGLNIISRGSDYSAPVATVVDAAGTGADIVVSIGGKFADGLRQFVDMLNHLNSDRTTGPVAEAIAGMPGPFNGGIRKFVDRLAGLTSAGANGIGQYIPVAVPDTTTYPGDDYYEIELGQYSEKLHTDLPPTLLRGYRQTNTADATVGAFHYLGPLIVAQRNRPVRLKFTNNLPTGTAGDLFVPVDTTLMGAGMGPMMGEMYTQNRAEIHLHGGLTPWISDGTPYQWTTPAGDPTVYPMGVSVYNVPDMPNPGKSAVQGELTYYYPNRQSARIEFYHDHAMGITRLNVYAGEAAGYLITDDVEADLIAGTNTTGVNPNLTKLLPDIGVPLVIQDKSFVDALTIGAQDPTWWWGSTPGTPVTGDLWMPHVYMPNQNPADIAGMNAFGRWHYGPWFWPPTDDITHPPVLNEYYDPINAPLENQYRPDTPNPSMAMESFMDTPLINGTVYPYVEVEPKLTRLRILNACNDRFVNLQIYKADPDVITADNRKNTEVRMVPALKNPAYPPLWPTDGREGGVPDPTMMGPSFIQIGTEGGFLPAPVVIPNQPITWNMNQTNFNFGNVKDHALLLGPAERADVLVDFSGYEGQTLILYNDAPAAFPAIDARYDYYTGSPDQTGTGGTPPTQPGFGPNTRTILQIRVGATATNPVPLNMTELNAVFQKGPDPAKRGVFEASQDPIIVPSSYYDSAYAGTFAADPYVRINEGSKTFQTLDGTLLSLPLQPKAIQDEQGEAYDIEYGRMSGFLGVQIPVGGGAQQFTLYPYIAPPIEIIGASLTPMSPVAGDGTQLWMLTHNGVDTHTLHFHLFNVQLVNRVAWDNAVILPDANELGWKETVRVNPLENIIFAMRPVPPTLPFDIPNSVRPLDPSRPLGEVLAGGPGGYKDPLGNPVTVTNHIINFGWEYVLHCHLLGHEEMDMMHEESLAVAPNAATGLTAAPAAVGIDLAWTDNSINETNFLIEKSTDPAFLTGVTTISIGADVTAYNDPVFDPLVTTYYRVAAANVVGDIDTPGFPVMNAIAAYTNTAWVGVDPTAPADPSNLTAVLQAGPGVLLSWTDNSITETGFVIERADNGGAFVQIAAPGAAAASGTVVTYTDTTMPAASSVVYQVKAVNGALSSAYTNTATVAIPAPPGIIAAAAAIPAAPSRIAVTRVAGSAGGQRIKVTWNDNSDNETGFTIQLATDPAFKTGLITATVEAGVKSYESGPLKAGVAYYVRVQATKGPSASAWVKAAAVRGQRP
jgi:FtsP/CotA-like multicopper oxidase with cupredoxin domain